MFSINIFNCMVNLFIIGDDETREYSVFNVDTQEEVRRSAPVIPNAQDADYKWIARLYDSNGNDKPSRSYESRLDKASLHWASEIRFELHIKFSQRWTGNENSIAWPSRPAYLTFLYFICSFTLKSVLYSSPYYKLFKDSSDTLYYRQRRPHSQCESKSRFAISNPVLRRSYMFEHTIGYSNVIDGMLDLDLIAGMRIYPMNR